MLKVSSHAFERLSLRLSLDSVKNNKEIKNMIEESYEVTLEVASKLVNIIHNKKRTNIILPLIR
ncbi:hypothetical protein [Dehalobacter restrictus]|uniref:Uncharacterized protein n=1 Tax=Dehalobacter restrictus (strain DSM 9455 / PER-K23) TaxID=871738 RepID=A0ABM5P9R7_DEHRP|nr:hypothetical protein [Dehalobacter restrictus]AHF11245.1 hypothetical protein DEHRE_02300 [Dehalobacter restrictus DSM 9455]